MGSKANVVEIKRGEMSRRMQLVRAHLSAAQAHAGCDNRAALLCIGQAETVLAETAALLRNGGAR